MREVKRFGFGLDGPGFRQCSDGCYVLISDFDRVSAERDALYVALGQSGEVKNELQQRLTAADERADVMEGLLRKALVAMKRIYLAGEDRILELGGDCDSAEMMMQSDPAAMDIRAALKPAEGGGDEL